MAGPTGLQVPERPAMERTQWMLAAKRRTDVDR
jgi:hypothetical protein